MASKQSEIKCAKVVRWELTTDGPDDQSIYTYAVSDNVTNHRLYSVYEKTASDDSQIFSTAKYTDGTIIVINEGKKIEIIDAPKVTKDEILIEISDDSFDGEQYSIILIRPNIHEKIGYKFSSDNNHLKLMRLDSQIVIDTQFDKHNNMTECKVISERRFVIFAGCNDLKELEFHYGYITEDSRYIAPNMCKVSGNCWINIGKIYGHVVLTDHNNNFFMSFFRDFATGELDGELRRTTFIPLFEHQLPSEQSTIVNNEKLFTRYYHHGYLTEQKVYINHIVNVRKVLTLHLPKDLVNMVMGY